MFGEGGTCEDSEVELSLIARGDAIICLVFRHSSLECAPIASLLSNEDNLTSSSCGLPATGACFAPLDLDGALGLLGGPAWLRGVASVLLHAPIDSGSCNRAVFARIDSAR